MLPRIVIRRKDGLGRKERTALRCLSKAVYPPAEDDWAGSAIEWADSDWTVLIQSEDAIVCHVGVVVRLRLKGTDRA